MHEPVTACGDPSDGSVRRDCAPGGANQQSEVSRDRAIETREILVVPENGTKAWGRQQLESPHAQPDKADRIRRMFNSIAPTYERVNSLFSGGRDA